MVLLTRKFFKYSLKALFFVILVVFYYILYMKWALEQYNEKRTTMAESIKQAKKLEYPILVFCPEPGFKQSFFKEMKRNMVTGTETFLWNYFSGYKNVLENVSSIPDVYKNMSYVFGVNWGIFLLPVSLLGKR